jgi:hypothetical protein
MIGYGRCVKAAQTPIHIFRAYILKDFTGKVKRKSENRHAISGNDRFDRLAGLPRRGETVQGNKIVVQ